MSKGRPRGPMGHGHGMSGEKAKDFKSSYETSVSIYEKIPDTAWNYDCFCSRKYYI